MKNIILRIFFGILSLGISQLVCYFFIDDVFVRFATEPISFICLRIVIAIIFYISLNWIIKNRIYNFEKDMLFLSYLFLSICLSLFRLKLDYYKSGNLNLVNIINYSKTTILFNIIFYIPFGFYLRSRLKVKEVYKFIIFLLYIVIIECSQHWLNVGFFDINDVILNCLGFIIGYFFTGNIIKFFTPKKLNI